MSEQNEQEKLMKDAQFRKSLSIAFFNSTNSAIELIASGKVNPKEGEGVRELLTYWRDWFLEEHKNYYATVISNIGLNFKVEDSIARLKATQTLEELKSVWIGFSADERQNDEIIKVKEEMKNTHEKSSS